MQGLNLKGRRVTAESSCLILLGFHPLGQHLKAWQPGPEFLDDQGKSHYFALSCPLPLRLEVKIHLLVSVLSMSQKTHLPDIHKSLLVDICK